MYMGHEPDDIYSKGSHLRYERECVSWVFECTHLLYTLSYPHQRTGPLEVIIELFYVRARGESEKREVTCEAI